MRIISAVLVFFTIAFTGSSCQREIDGSSEDNTTNSNDSTYVKRLIVLDTNFVSGTDTIIKWELSYNTDKRLSRLFYTGYKNISGPGRIWLYEDIKYKYQGANPYPEYIVDSLTDLVSPSSSHADTTFLYYNNGTVIKDSSTAQYGSALYYTVNEFTSLGTNRYKLIQKSPDLIAGGVRKDSTHIFVNWQNGNLLKEIDSLWIPSLGIWQIRTTTISYDTKPNPFKDMSIPYPTPANGDLPSTGIQAFFLPSNNNMVIQTDYSGTYTLNYEYNALGFPKIARDQDGLKIIYEYTRL